MELLRRRKCKNQAHSALLNTCGVQGKEKCKNKRDRKEMFAELKLQSEQNMERVCEMRRLECRGLKDSCGNVVVKQQI
ncbi:Hypothetical predicted protein [Octopus vulgaris]|uniref:Uncharacterized protein n=1 Tax=Octopus vulgaris TaxID=6645 RepID=A0AA36AMH0_OCTVU|nr:Hypothetical predicted protein [Octopus vulgaris]